MDDVMADKHYEVSWTIDVWAKSPRDAAEEALKIQRDPDSIALVFEMVDDEETATKVDLWEDEV